MQQPPPPLKRFVTLSALTHLVLVLFCFVVSPLAHLSREQAPIMIEPVIELPRGMSEEIGLGLRESKTLPEAPLPKEIPEEPTPPPATATPMPVPTPPKPEAKPPPKPKPELSPAEKKIADALAKIDADLKKRSKPPEMAQVKNPSEGSKYGTSDKPLTKIPPEAERMRYIAAVKSKIQREWNPPPGARGEAVLIIVRISASGHVTSAAVARRSSSPALDASITRAAYRASPLPIPPASVKEEALTKGFTIGFR